MLGGRYEFAEPDDVRGWWSTLRGWAAGIPLRRRRARPQGSVVPVAVRNARLSPVMFSP